MKLLQFFEAIDDDMRETFSCGACYFLALALHKKYGWPMVGYFDRDYEAEETQQALGNNEPVLDDIHHMWVEIPGTGKAIDIYGLQNANELKQNWSQQSGEHEGRGLYVYDVDPDWIADFAHRWNPTKEVRDYIWGIADHAVEELSQDLKQAGLIEAKRQPAMVVKDVFHATHNNTKFDKLALQQGLLFFSKEARSTEFGPRVFTGDVWFNDPFLFSETDIYNVESILGNDLAKKVVMDWLHVSSWEQVEEEMLEGYDLHEFIAMSMTGDEGFWQHPIIIDAMKKSGYDGVISNDPFGGSTEYVIFDEKQFISKGQFTNEGILEGAAIRTYDPGVLEWLQEALSRPDADDLYLHGSRQVQNVFSPEDKRHEHALIHFSKLTDPRFQDVPFQAEYYGPKLLLCKLSYKKPFDVRYPNREPAQMHKELVPHEVSQYRLDYGDIYHIIEPALAKGYDLFVVWEVAARTESYAVPDAKQVEVIDTYDSRGKI